MKHWCSIVEDKRFWLSIFSIPNKHPLFTCQLCNTPLCIKRKRGKCKVVIFSLFSFDKKQSIYNGIFLESADRPIQSIGCNVSGTMLCQHMQFFVRSFSVPPCTIMFVSFCFCPFLSVFVRFSPFK